MAVDYYYDSPTTIKTITIFLISFVRLITWKVILSSEMKLPKDYPALIIPKFVVQPNFLEGSADGDAAVKKDDRKALPTESFKEMMIMEILEPVEGS